MAPKPIGIAIILGAGPTLGAGIARILAHPQHGNLAVALLSRSCNTNLAETLSQQSGGVLKAFKSDTSPDNLRSGFSEVRAWAKTLGGDNGAEALPLKLAVWNVKNSHKINFDEEDPKVFDETLSIYVTGAMAFAQETVKWFLCQGKDFQEGEPMEKRGTLIFTGTMGALRTSAGFASYGASRAGVRMLAQSLAREYSARGIHVAHGIANGLIVDASTLRSDGPGEGQEENEKKVQCGKAMRAETVGKVYLQIMNQDCDLWVHELDLRPAAEKF